MNSQEQQFDQKLRHQWQTAAAQLPGHIRLQLSPSIAAQQRQNRPARARWLPFGVGAAFASLALVAALVISPLWQNPAEPGAAQLADTQTDIDSDSDDGLLAVTPDFYAWLESDEVRTLAAN